MTETDEIFDYVVAGQWSNGEMAIYTYGQQIQTGTIEGALWLLERATRNSSLGEHKIYKIRYEEVVHG